MLADGQRAGWLAVAWREVAVDGGGGRTLVHSGGGRGALEVVRVWWKAAA